MKLEEKRFSPHRYEGICFFFFNEVIPSPGPPHSQGLYKPTDLLDIFSGTNQLQSNKDALVSQRGLTPCASHLTCVKLSQNCSAHPDPYRAQAAAERGSNKSNIPSPADVK